MDHPQPAPTVPPPRSLTWRAVTLGLVFGVLFAVIAPINDWYLKNMLG